MSIYERASDLSDNPCFTFNSDGTMVERKNSGDCGTPPIVYANYGGTWRIINDTLVRVNVGYWGGTTTYNMNIKYVSPTTLNVIFHYGK